MLNINFTVTIFNLASQLYIYIYFIRGRQKNKQIDLFHIDFNTKPIELSYNGDNKALSIDVSHD
eukprot:snap_masked-scaffold_39-processed-gene-1.29-mRNA-1 protein AED:1.00 eAED:1.00 QI:0/0/0/0/1/1/2/0/63